MTDRNYAHNWTDANTSRAVPRRHWAWAYLATFVVCLLVSSPLGFMAGMVTARMVSLTVSSGQIPEVAYITWAVVAAAIQITGLMQTRECQRGGSGAARA